MVLHLVAPLAFMVASITTAATAQRASISPMGLLAGDSLSFSAGPSGLSQNAWVGTSGLVPGAGGTGRARAVRRQSGTLLDLGILSGSQDAIAAAISLDSRTIVGRMYGGTATRAFRWRDGALSDLGRPNYPAVIAAAALDLTPTGDAILGTAIRSAGGPIGWVLRGSVFTLILPSQGGSRVDVAAISGDGVTVVGSSDAGGVRFAFLWTPAQGLVRLSQPPTQAFAVATDVSDDGSVIVGATGTGSIELPALWHNQALFLLPAARPDDLTARATAISADGSTIVGESVNGTLTTDRKPWVYTQRGGIFLLEELLSQQGADLTGWRLINMTSISPDGLRFSGSGQRTVAGIPRIEAFTAALRTLCPCDWNSDGGIDGSDVDAYFSDWVAGIGDMNLDGGVDGADVQVFFDRWVQGAC